MFWVEVGGLPEQVTVDVLELYFENRRSGGKEGAVKDIWLDAKSGLARIAFSEQAGELASFLLHGFRRGFVLMGEDSRRKTEQEKYNRKTQAVFFSFLICSYQGGCAVS